MQSRQLPVLDASGDLVQYIDSGIADTLPHRYEPRIKLKTKNGKHRTKVTGYWLIPFPPHMDARPNSPLGLAFVQHLSTGNSCYALHGTPGSS